MIFEFDCQVCGAHVRTKRSPANTKVAPKYCSQKCNGAAKHARKRGPTPNVRYHCLTCGKVVATYRSPSARKGYVPKFCGLKCLGKAQAGSDNPAWSGGRHVGANGYVVVFLPDHPYANVSGYVYEHRFVMEQAIGRYLRPEEVVHHDNKIKTDNAIGNLRRFSNQSAHSAFHAAERRRAREGASVRAIVGGV